MAYYVLGANVADSAEYSGFGVKLSHPERVTIGLWIVWVWALLRYAQRFYELAVNLWGDVVADVKSEDRRLALSWGLREARCLAKAGHFDERGKRNVAVNRVIWHYEAGSDGGRTAEPFMPARGGGRQYGLYVSYNWRSDQYELGSTGRPFAPEMRSSTLRWHLAKAWTYALFVRPAFSEHIFPLLLAIATPIVAAITYVFGNAPV